MARPVGSRFQLDDCKHLFSDEVAFQEFVKVLRQAIQQNDEYTPVIANGVLVTVLKRPESDQASGDGYQP